MRYLAVGKINVTDELTKKIFGLSFDINALWAVAIAGLIVCGGGLYVARKATSGVPSRAQLLWETLVGAVSDQVEAMIGPEGRPIVPLALTLFVFILVCNWMEIFFWTGHNPAYLPTPASNVNLTYMMALIVFVITTFVAIKHAGIKKYAWHLVYPLPTTWVEELAKPLSLSLRLFGNVFAGALIFSLVAGLFQSLLPVVFVIDIVWLPFDLIIFLIQAFIFSMLTIIYYQQALRVGQDGH